MQSLADAGLTPDSAKERVLARVVPEPNSGCWLWLGEVAHGTGYGRLKVRLRVCLQAHRVSYEAFRGPIPGGLVLDHLCRVRSCVNPAHLEPVTQRENVRRGAIGTRAQAGYCRNGHPRLTPNVYTYPSGYQECRTCRAIHHVASNRRKVA